MPRNEQLLNYLYWLDERGLSWPSISTAHSDSKTSETPCPYCHGQPQREGAAAAPIVWISQMPLLAGSPGRELLEKMMAAMGLPRSDFQIASLSCCADSKEKQSLAFLPNSFGIFMGCSLPQLPESPAMGLIQSHHGWKFVFTYHPEELLQQPSLKGATWQHLKTVLKELLASY